MNKNLPTFICGILTCCLWAWNILYTLFAFGGENLHLATFEGFKNNYKTMTVLFLIPISMFLFTATGLYVGKSQSEWKSLKIFIAGTFVLAILNFLYLYIVWNLVRYE